MVRLSIKLKPYLESQGISLYRLTKEAKGMGYDTVYKVANGQRRPNLDTLETILGALRKITKAKVELSDLLEVVEIEEPKLKTATGPITKGKLEITPSKGGKPKGLGKKRLKLPEGAKPSEVIISQARERHP
jgi:hypothetical protein